MKKNLLILLFISGIALAGCVSGPPPEPEGTPSPAVSAPDWFFNPPEEDAKYKYYVGYGISDTGEPGEAEDIAIQDIITNILYYIGVSISAETTAEAKASLDTFESNLTQVVKTSGSAKFSGFEIMEKLPFEKEGKVTMYVLCRYDKKELEAEKARIQKVFTEKQEAVSVPEQKGKDLYARGQYFESAIKFIEAASAAGKGDLTNARIKLERNINQAKDAIEKINLIKLNDSLKVLGGEEFTEPFMLKVISGGNEDSPGVPGVSIRITYKTFNTARTRLVSKTVIRKTGTDGTLVFDHPPAEAIGDGQVAMVLDLDDYMEVLQDIPYEWYDAVDSLDSLVATKKAVFSFQVMSNAVNVSTGIIITDLDVDNTILTGTTDTNVLQVLSKEKFKIRKLPVDPEDLLEKSDFDVISMLSDEYKDRVERAVFGTAQVLEYSQDNGRVIARCSATVQVIDLETEEILLTVIKTGRGLGNNEDQAAKAGFKNLGGVIAKEILNNLR